MIVCLPPLSGMGDTIIMSLPFIHLRVHSSYSLAEGMLPIKPLVEKAAKMNQPAL
ncbi:MAG: PHP domain-containing protein, partial [Candidatus Puniceispirillales bacterium]